MWRKILSGIISLFVLMAVLSACAQQKPCGLCSSFRYHAPCLMDLETGELVELSLYRQHRDLVAELADLQPETKTFSYIRLGDVDGRRDTYLQRIELSVPMDTLTEPSVLCKACRKQLDSGYKSRYILADLYAANDKKLLPICRDMELVLRCYNITATAGEKENVLRVTIQGTLLP